MHGRTTTGVLAVPVAMLLGAAPAVAADGGPPPRSTVTLRATAEFGTTAGSYAYDTTVLPRGASAAVWSTSVEGSTTTLLLVRGLAPGRSYGAHLHVNACGEAPSAAGAHFQHLADPVQPSTDPAYANPANEVWLDLRTDEAGTGQAYSVNDWQYGMAAPMSLVIHTMATQTGAGVAGTAGARVGCVTLDRAAG